MLVHKIDKIESKESKTGANRGESNGQPSSGKEAPAQAGRTGPRLQSYCPEESRIEDYLAVRGIESKSVCLASTKSRWYPFRWFLACWLEETSESEFGM